MSDGVAHAYTVSLSGSTQSNQTSEAGSQGTGPGLTSDTVTAASLPFSDSTLAVDGVDSSETTYDFSNAGFLFSVDHARDGDFSHWTSSNGGIYFSVDDAVDYVAAGSYSAVNPDPQNIALLAGLFDLTTSTTVFLSEQQSSSELNESFVLGLMEGDLSNQLIGSLTGTLIAGHDYIFQYDVTSANINTLTGGAVTGLGNLSLTFVPEPSTAVLLGIGLGGLARRRTRRRG